MCVEIYWRRFGEKGEVSRVNMVIVEQASMLVGGGNILVCVLER